jgi:PAS domain S-box-containing protein
MNDGMTPLDRAERALQDSETRLQQVLDNTSAVVFAKDAQGRYLFVNRMFEDLARCDVGQILGHTDEQIFPPDIATRFRHNDLRVLHEKRAIEFEEAGDFGNGTRIFLAAKFPLFDSTGVVYAVCGVATDITERKRLEEALSSAALAVSQSEGEPLYRELARYLATILGVDAAFISTVDPTTPGQMQVRALLLDGEIQENFAYSIAGTPCETVVEHGFRLYPSRLRELFPGDVGFRDLGFESYAGHPLNDAAGQPRGLIAVVSRRTLGHAAFVESVLRIFAVRVNAELERMAAHDALRASEEQYRTVFNASADALVLWNSRSERVDVNPAYERMYGYSREEVLAGMRARELPEGYQQLQAGIIRRTLAGHSFCGEIETVRRGGEPFPIEVRTVPILHRGEPHVLAMIRDLTERRRVETEQTRLEAQLRQAQKMEAIGQLTGGIAHDFNNLLTSIMGYVALAREREAALGDRKLSGYLAQAERSCERARDLIQQMLMFSRGQRGTPRTIALAPLVEAALESVRPALPSMVRLTTRFPEEAAPVRVDPLQLEQVLLNLCINARDAIEGAGAVTVTVRPLQAQGLACASCRGTIDGECVELCVEDTGQGMTPEVFERIFEPFYSTKADGKGTGMGLAMVHGIVHEHGGHVVVETEPGRGSRFRVLWPAESSGREAAASGVPVPPGHARLPRHALAGTVLIVDDEVAVGEFMRELLETRGLTATFVPGPQAALELVSAAPGRFDAVITDQSMPRMTGVQLAQTLQALRGDLPVILYSGYGEGLDQYALKASGIRTVLRKPVDPHALEAALTTVLTGSRAQG